MILFIKYTIKLYRIVILLNFILLINSCNNRHSYKNYYKQKLYLRKADTLFENDSFKLAEPYYLKAMKIVRPDVDVTLNSLTVYMHTDNRKQFNRSLKNMPKHAIKCYTTDTIRYGTFMGCVLERFIFSDSLLMEYIKKDYYSAKILTHLTSQEKIIASKKKMRLLSELIKLNETDIKLRENYKISSYELDSINNFQFYSIIKSGWPNRNKIGDHTHFLVIHMPDTYFASPYNIHKKAYKAAQRNKLDWSVYEHLIRRGPYVSELVFNKKSLDIYQLSQHLNLNDELLTLDYLIGYCLSEFYEIPLNKIHLSIEYKDEKSLLRYQNILREIEQSVSPFKDEILNLVWSKSKANKISISLK